MAGGAVHAMRQPPPALLHSDWSCHRVRPSVTGAGNCHAHLSPISLPVASIHAGDRIGSASVIASNISCATTLTSDRVPAEYARPNGLPPSQPDDFDVFGW